MSTFNLRAIIEKYELDEDSLSKELFPKNKFPKVALARITSGVSYLDTWQLGILSEIIGLPITDLFSMDNWNKVIQGNKIKFVKNNHRVELNLETLVSEIYCLDKLVAVETLIPDRNIKLTEYLKLVDKTIINLI
jgi:hypothetical protein